MNTLPRTAALLALASLAGACAPEYGVRIAFASRAAREGSATVDIYIVPSCADVTPGVPPPEPLLYQTLRVQGGAGQPLGPLRNGPFGVYAFARHETCLVMAHGCTTYDPASPAAGESIDVMLEVPDPAAAPIYCPDARPLCQSGVCQAGPCPDGQVPCNGRCVTLADDESHCGRCNNPCAADEQCRTTGLITTCVR